MVFALLLVRSLSVLHEDHFSAPIDMKRAHFHSKSLYKPHRKRKPRSAIGLFKLLASNCGSQFLFQPFGPFDLWQYRSAIQARRRSAIQAHLSSCGRGDVSTTSFGSYLNSILTRGADYPHPILVSTPSFESHRCACNPQDTSPRDLCFMTLLSFVDNTCQETRMKRISFCRPFNVPTATYPYVATLSIVYL